MFHAALSITYLAAIGFCLYTSCWLVFKAGRNRLSGALAACQILVIIWCIPQLFLSFPVTRGLKYVLYGISYIGISLIGPAWLIFSVIYCGYKAGYRVKALLLGISVFDYSMLLTNEFHHLFYRSFQVWQVVYGPVFYIHMWYTYGCVLLGMFLVLREFWQKQVEKIHMALILSAAAVPLGFNLLYLSGLVKTGFDLTPPAFALSSFFMLLAVFRYDFLDVNQVAFEYILESVEEGVIVFHRKGRIIYCNQAASGWLGVKAGDGFPKLKAVLGRMGIEAEADREMETDYAVLTLESGEKIQLKQYFCRDKRGMVLAGIFLLADVGEYYRLLEQEQELAESSRQLAAMEERSRIAQEVHDTAGHTLVMIQSLIKLSQMEWENAGGAAGNLKKQNVEAAEENLKGQPGGQAEENLKEQPGGQAEENLKGQPGGQAEENLKGQPGGQAERNLSGQDMERGKDLPEPSGKITESGPSGQKLWDYLEQARILSAEGIRNLRQAINHMRRDVCEEFVSQGIRRLAGQVKEIPVEVEFQGEDGEMYSQLSRIVYSCVQEAITNCLKYAQASRMDVILKFQPQDLSLYIFDDGQGCGTIRESHGLFGIRQRVNQAGGQARFFSAEGQGFQIYIRLPVK